MSLLSVSNLSVAFGGLKAVNQVSLDVNEKEIVALIGPNGAGKTTVFNLLTGFTKPLAGEVWLDGEDITGLRSDVVVRRGLARTFQNIRLFRRMSALDNVLSGYFIYGRTRLATALLRLPAYWREEADFRRQALELLSIFQLADIADREVGTLPYGQQRQIEILRALAAGPRVLLLDEPAAGMNPSETASLMKTIEKIRETFGLATLLIEHDMNLVMGISDRIFVLDYGIVLASGAPESIRSNQAVIKAYLGEVNES